MTDDILEEIVGGTRALEEKIAETKDPETRKKLQEILEKRKKTAHENLRSVYIVGCVIFAILIISNILKCRHDVIMNEIERESIQRRIEMLK